MYTARYTETKFIKYAGIPRNCSQCQIDLLDHEVHHHIVHYRCKFCRETLRRVQNARASDSNLFIGDDSIRAKDDSTCSFCYKIFHAPSNRKLHEKTEHSEKEKPFKCLQCEKTFASAIALNHHQREHTDETNKYLCNICRKEFSSGVCLKRHIESIHNSEVRKFIQCHRCEQTFTRVDNLTRHLTEVHKESPVNLHFCPQFSKPYKCKQCSRRFMRKEVLVNHTLSVHARDAESQQESYFCAKCSKTFGSRWVLHRHVDSINKSSKSAYKCGKCDKMFSRNDERII